MHHINEELVDECKTMPGYIEVVDNYGGKKNTYVYRKLTDIEIRNGKTFDGRKIDTSKFKEGEKYYILEIAIDENGTDIMAKDHVEIYKLEYSYDEKTDTYNYDLVQEEGMDGSGKSSIIHNK